MAGKGTPCQENHHETSEGCDSNDITTRGNELTNSRNNGDAPRVQEYASQNDEVKNANEIKPEGPPSYEIITNTAMVSQGTDSGSNSAIIYQGNEISNSSIISRGNEINTNGATFSSSNEIGTYEIVSLSNCNDRYDDITARLDRLNRNSIASSTEANSNEFTDHSSGITEVPLSQTKATFNDFVTHGQEVVDEIDQNIDTDTQERNQLFGYNNEITDSTTQLVHRSHHHGDGSDTEYADDALDFTFDVDPAELPSSAEPSNINKFTFVDSQRQISEAGKSVSEIAPSTGSLSATDAYYLGTQGREIPEEELNRGFSDFSWDDLRAMWASLLCSVTWQTFQRDCRVLRRHIPVNYKTVLLLPCWLPVVILLYLAFRVRDHYRNKRK